ncbi:MAG: ferredoxin [Actinomycetota bacterium]|nr:ferredoxin [Actinomycetota bacterium]
MCISVAPDLFELDEDGYSRPLRDPVPGDVHERAREAGAACPVAAITVEEGA